MEWIEQLASLSLLTSRLSYLEFLRLSKLDLNPDTIIREVESVQLKQFLKENPMWWKESEKNFSWFISQQAQWIYPGHKKYPSSFFDLEEPPLFLSYFGNSCWERSQLFSVVGSREPSSDSLIWMDQHLGKLVSQAWVVVSGGARGVDQKAHSMSLRQVSPTICFLPSGLAKIYPSQFSSWIKPIVEAGGAVMSELSPFTEMKKHYFEQRNRMIAGLSMVTLVVEARRKSGSLITARLAYECGRTVAVIPGFPGHTRWEGSVDLLFNGAQPIRDEKDLMMLLSLNSNFVLKAKN